MNYYPIFLDISGKPCTVVGGGEVAYRKVVRLLSCGASVSVVARDLTAALAALRDAGQISHIVGEYSPAVIEGAVLVIGATDSPSTNEAVFRDCRERGVMVNIVDAPALCDFIVPAVFTRGDLVIAVSTGGKSPALARMIRDELEGRYGDEYAVLLHIMGELRGRILARGWHPDENREMFMALVQSPILEKIRQSRWEEVEDMVKNLTGEEITLRVGS